MESLYCSPSWGLWERLPGPPRVRLVSQSSENLPLRTVEG
ncbi:hypothetical protein CCACVL1_24115 [Corchorus capsularis]|uniref:Uncharacterized protein n=1 Tax=Corchorus capsularis TaxID=210143 RepID=A0A1R3GQX5_COCAP|nr:hypothetical protein CCACVL1_24115 [Corchorus capsularis]